jgi:hypothetical protein
MSAPGEALAAPRGVAAGDLDHIAISRAIPVRIHEKLMFALCRDRDSLSFAYRLTNVSKIPTSEPAGRSARGGRRGDPRPGSSCRASSRAHMATASSSLHSSGRRPSIDGFGDFVSRCGDAAAGNKIEVEDWVEFPRTRWAFCTAITVLGFYGDEFKVMGWRHA